MVLFHYYRGELFSNTAFAFRANCNDVYDVLHGSKGFDEDNKEVASFNCSHAKRLIVIGCLHSERFIRRTINKKESHDFEAVGEPLGPLKEE